MIRMQLKDLPLLLAGALGAAITGMVAPGLSLLFGEIQKVTSEHSVLESFLCRRSHQLRAQLDVNDPLL